MAFRIRVGPAALARDRLSVASVVFFVVAAAAPLTVVGAISTAYGVGGFSGIPAAYVGVGGVLLVFAVGFVAMSRHIRNAGAFYSYVAAGLGRPAGVAAAGVALLAYGLMTVGLLGGFGGVAALAVFTVSGLSVPWWYCALLAWAVICVLGVLRITLTGRVLAIILCAEVAIVILYDATMFLHPAGGVIDPAPISPTHLLEVGFLAAMVGAVGSSVGFESTVVFAEESRSPRKTIPRATYLAILITSTLYAVSAWALPVATGADRIHEQATLHGTNLIFDLVLPNLGQTLVDVGGLLILTSLFAAALAFHNIVARYLFALGRERVLFGFLATTTRSGAPGAGSLTTSALSLLGITAAVWLGRDPMVDLLFRATVLGGFGVVLLMTATSVAVISYFARTPTAAAEEFWWRRTLFPMVATCALTAVVVGGVAQFHVLLGLSPDSELRSLIPVGFGTVAVLGLIWAQVLRVTQPSVYMRVGLGVDSYLPLPVQRAAAITPATPPPAERVGAAT